MRRGLALACLGVVAAMAAGCGDDDESVENIDLVGLSGEVEVVQDDRGMWHIYAENLEDAYQVQGYLMARDRLMQMELVRRQVRGELSALFAGATREDDITARFEGHARLADQIWPTLSPEEQGHLEAYSAGVNAHIAEVREDPDLRPTGSTLVTPDDIRDWEPTDTLSIARFLTASLSLDIRDDLRREQRIRDWQEAFVADACLQADAPDNCGAFETRANAFHDIFPMAPAEEVAVMDGFPTFDYETGFTALQPSSSGGGGGATTDRSRPSRETLDAAVSFADRVESLHERVMGGDLKTRGSNSWIVSGEHTASGFPMMANDPHLSLTSPALWWYVHIDTQRLGDGDVNTQGFSLVGTPGATFGWNEHVAWGWTTHGYDVTDNWHETLSPDCQGVMWDDPDDEIAGPVKVPFEEVDEEIQVGNDTETVTFLKTPHHGFIIPETMNCEDGVGGEAISVRWTGMEPSNELGAILGLNFATSMEEVETAMDKFETGGQNLVVASSDGRIYWTTQMNMPLRTGTMDYDPADQTGHSPCLPMPGSTAEYEWDGYLSDDVVPHALDPAKGYVATANGDATGVTFDGDPHNDDAFIGCDFDEGYRIARITERLEELKTRGDITPEDMQALQGEVQSALGRRITPMMLEELDRAEAAMGSPDEHPDLTAAVDDAGAAMGTILAMRDRLRDWGPMYDYDTPAGVPDSGTPEPVDASIATSIFNVAFSYLMQNTFHDEFDALDGTLDGNMRHRTSDVLRTVRWDLDDTMRAKHISAVSPTTGLMVYWDDLDTADVEETRGDRVVRAFAAAAAQLETLFGTADMNEWRWGKLHTVRLETLIPGTGLILSLPPDDSPEFPDGFPRHGDREAIDASNFGAYNVDDFDYGSGPQHRTVVEMTPDGPRAWTALPGGQSMDPESSHFDDEIELWRKNEAPPMYFDFDDVTAHGERTIRFTD
ncbi:MAG: penicillin acylase family protein [Myxococcota bacterium]